VNQSGRNMDKAATAKDVIRSRLVALEIRLHDIEDRDLVHDWDRNAQSRRCHRRIAAFHVRTVKDHLEPMLEGLAGASDDEARSLTEVVTGLSGQIDDCIHRPLADDGISPVVAITAAAAGVTRVRMFMTGFLLMRSSEVEVA
jgi:hypothetical protein